MKKTKAKKMKVNNTTPRASARPAAETQIRKTWNETVQALTSAEARVQDEVKALLKRNRIGTKDGATVLRDLGALVERERRKGVKELETRFAALQTRVRKDGKVISRRVDEAVQGALASFNIPSRQEVQELTRKVNELSRKVGALRR